MSLNIRKDDGKTKKKDLYQGRSLFDFIEQDIKHKFKTLGQGEVNEQGNNTRGNEVTSNTAEYIHTSSRILGKDKVANKQRKSVVYDGNDGLMRVKNTRTNRHTDAYGGQSLFSYEQGEMGREGKHDETEIAGREEKGIGLSDTSTRELYLSRRQGHGEIRETLPQQDYIAILTMRCENTWRADLYDNYGMKILIRWMYY